MTKRMLLAGVALAMAGCVGGDKPAVVDRAKLAVFGTLPAAMNPSARPAATDAVVQLGRKLFFETRLSAGFDLSCNSCHSLANGGADTGSVSVGHQGRKGGRNSPTVFNAAGHLAQFWDGRAPDIEAQALGPILNPAEMAMPAAPQVMHRLASDPQYRRMFAAAFPGDHDPMTFENVGRAIGAFERMLVTPSRWDDYLAGADTALSQAETAGLSAFIEAGCHGCHTGVYVGGSSYQKAGLARTWPDTADAGRAAVTHDVNDRMVFKVPSLRNIARTAPYFHNGAVRSLDTAVVWMGRHQLGKELTREQVAGIVAWFDSLTGNVPADLIAPPPSSDPKSP